MGVTLCLFGVCLTASLPLWASSAPPLDAGHWSIVTHQKISGSALPFARRQHTMCLTPTHAFPKVGDQACHPQLTGETQTHFIWHLHCTPKGALPASGQAVIHYQDQGKRLRGHIELRIAGEEAWSHSLYPFHLALHEQFKGRRIGPCKQLTDLG